ncbi:peptide-N-glycosidase F-related protein [Winogradskyella endarachnes]|uniref:Peptide-N-glycosidase F N-terminal domain-containing protein n=1 Tax=Winogradskyella endarachnes TaxID=2681965 RepID=A0A6L6U9E9_9FLAO|nr:peptide-N-glycosidase F-related protein [Winogradskyella endarachnes]MUU77557.1 hypothetical protein [Winogradskyella endarachnes]
MKNFKHKFYYCFILLFTLVSISCGNDDNGNSGSGETSSITSSSDALIFADTEINDVSVSQPITLTITDIETEINISSSANFQISTDNSTFSDNITISVEDLNNSQNIFIQFAPLSVGDLEGTVTIENEEIENIIIEVSGTGLDLIPTIALSSNQINFEDTQVNSYSTSENLTLTLTHITSNTTLTTSGGFEVSNDNSVFSNNLVISSEDISDTNVVFLRFTPQSIGDLDGVLTIENEQLDDDITVQLSGEGTPVIHNYQTFDQERVAFGGGYTQTSVQNFTLHDDLTNIETIKMYVQLTCPTGGCDEWDVFANVKVTDPISGERLEMARFITPYWNDNSQLERGFEFDVTDFKSLLTGTVELRIRTECWNAKGYEVSIDFDYIEGTPDYQYYEIARIINYDNGSAAGVPYGTSHDKDLTKTITIPSNAQSTHLRTIISGWGEAYPSDNDGRRCAEWCYRTHNININNVSTFDHYLGPLGCASNPVNNQAPGNWTPDRAGWCPGMEVPTRIDEFTNSVAGTSIDYEYYFSPWVVNSGYEAYYPISSFVVVKSDTPITRPVVAD